MFAGEMYLRFAADAADIDAFVKRSPSLKLVVPEVFSGGRQHLPYDEAAQRGLLEEATSVGDWADWKEHARHERFLPNKHWPEWYDPTITGAGRKYEFRGDPAQKGHNWGTVYVDDVRNVVLIIVIWS
jgi:hypothetical protein